MEADNGAQRINAATFAAKFKSKKECWNFLAIEAGGYLPPYSSITIFHMKQIISGKKKSKSDLNNAKSVTVLLNHHLVNIEIPHYENLDRETILEKAEEWPAVAQYLCDEREIDAWPRGYVCNVINSVTEGKFRVWVDKQIKERNVVMEEKGDMTIEITQSLAAAFNKSSYISSKPNACNSVF